MEKFKEKDLEEILKEFKNINKLQIELKYGIESKMTLKDVTIEYDNKIGYINIKSKNGMCRINTTEVYRYEKEGNKISISLYPLTMILKPINQ